MSGGGDSRLLPGPAPLTLSSFQSYDWRRVWVICIELGGGELFTTPHPPLFFFSPPLSFVFGGGGCARGILGEFLVCCVFS